MRKIHDPKTEQETEESKRFRESINKKTEKRSNQKAEPETETEGARSLPYIFGYDFLSGVREIQVDEIRKSSHLDESKSAAKIESP